MLIIIMIIDIMIIIIMVTIMMMITVIDDDYCYFSPIKDDNLQAPQHLGKGPSRVGVRRSYYCYYSYCFYPNEF